MDTAVRHHNRGGRRPNSGRKPLPADRRRSHRKCIRLTERENQLVSFLASKRKVSFQQAIYLLLKASMPILDRAEAASAAPPASAG